MKKRAEGETPAVILLHGLHRTGASMYKLEDALNAAGFKDTRCYTYSSRNPIAKEARGLAARIRKDWRDRPLHAVTHSLGGIVLRHIRDDRIRWRRLVMLAPPNQGSAVAANLVATAERIRIPASLVLGAAGAALAGAAKATKAEKPWPFPPAPFGVIAGTRSRDVTNPTGLLVSHRVFADDVAHDGTVTVEETKLDGMAGFVTVDASHTTIMNEPEVQRLVVSFLRTGTFASHA